MLLAAAGVLILPVMWRRGQLACLLKRLGTFVAALGVYFGGKWLLFGDLMQTSYYRKMRLDGAGTEYVLGALADYWRWILFAGVLVAVAAGLLLWRRRERGWNTFRCLASCSRLFGAGSNRGRGRDPGGVSAGGADRRLRLSLSGQFLCLPVSARRGRGCISAVGRCPASRETCRLRKGDRDGGGVDSVDGVDCGERYGGRIGRPASPPVHAGAGIDDATSSTFVSASFSAIEFPISKS